MNHGGIWQIPGLLDRMKQLAGTGKSASEIAPTLSHEYRVRVTRNAVIGKCQRTATPLRGSVRAGARPAVRRPAKPRKPRLHPLASMPYGPPVRPLSIVEVGPSQCRYPVEGTGADMKVCGAKTHKVGDRHLPYCQHHACIAYEAGKKRKAEKSDPVYQPRNAMAFDFRRGVA